MTYTVRGRQYIAVTSGNVSRVSFKSSGTPKVVVFSTAPNAEMKTQYAGDDARQTSVDRQGRETVDLNWGKMVFQRHCSSCHGPQGQGLSAPSLVGIADRKSVEQVVQAVKTPALTMPGLYPALLSDDDVQDVVAYIRSLR